MGAPAPSRASRTWKPVQGVRCGVGEKPANGAGFDPTSPQATWLRDITPG